MRIARETPQTAGRGTTKWWPVAAVLLLAAVGPGAGAEASPPRLADLVLDGIVAARREAGAPALERRPMLEAVAMQTAREVAEAGRQDIGGPIEARLREAGVHGFRRAVPMMQTLRGYDRPEEAALDHWRHYHQVWEALMDPAFDAIGLAAARDARGTWVLVGVLVEDRESFDPADLEARMTAAIDGTRAEHGLAALRASAALAGVAREHSRDMARRRYFAHLSPEGGDVADRLEAAGLRFSKAAENIFRIEGSDDPVEQALAGWMLSPGHRANILDPDLTEAGVGVAVDDSGAIYFTQVFRRPPPAGSR